MNTNPHITRSSETQRMQQLQETQRRRQIQEMEFRRRINATIKRRYKQEF